MKWRTSVGFRFRSLLRQYRTSSSTGFHRSHEVTPGCYHPEAPIREIRLVHLLVISFAPVSVITDVKPFHEHFWPSFAVQVFCEYIDPVEGSLGQVMLVMRMEHFGVPSQGKASAAEHP